MIDNDAFNSHTYFFLFSCTDTHGYTCGYVCAYSYMCIGIHNRSSFGSFYKLERLRRVQAHTQTHR